MTLVLAAHSRNTVWIVADRCLYYGPGQTNELGIKAMRLETVDGTGLLAYAGLGATRRGTQPSEWMANVLRGRGALGFEESLRVLATVAQREILPHLLGLPSGHHVIVAVGYVRSIGAVTYAIDNPGGGAFRLQRLSVAGTPGGPPTPWAIAGSGGLHLLTRSGEWRRAVADVLKAHGQGRIDDLVVADHLAAINHSAYLAMQRTHGSRNTVGPRSIVIWAHRPENMGGKGGGNDQSYSGRKRDRVGTGVPTIVRGVPIQEIMGVMIGQFTKASRLLRNDPDAATVPLVLDHEEIERRVNALSRAPDEHLR